MEHITVKRNRLMTKLLTILFCTVIFCCALLVNFVGATAEEGGSAYAAYKYELTGVYVSFNDDWIFTEDTPDSALYKMVSVTVTYKDLDTDESEQRVLEVSPYGQAATGEAVAFVRDTDTKKVTVTVTTAGSQYTPATVSGTSAAYTLSSATPVVNGITAYYDQPSESDINTRTQPNTTAVKSNVRVYETYNDGTDNNNTVSSFNLGGDLFPSTVTADMAADSLYAKEIPVTSGAYSTTVLITGIKFIVPSEVLGIDGTFQTQVARSKQLDIRDLTVLVAYRNPFKQFAVPAAAFPADCFSATYTDAAGKEIVDANNKPVLTTSVKNVTLSFVFLSWNITEPVETTFEDIEVSRIAIHTPTFPAGINATKTTVAWNEGASVDISGWDFDTLHVDTGDAPDPQISFDVFEISGGAATLDESVTVGAVVDEKINIEFPTASYVYRVKVTLPDGGDFMWDSPFNGNKSDDNMIMTFDVQVDKGTPVVTLGGIADVVYGTANGSGTLTAEVENAAGTSVDIGKTWSEVAPTNADAFKNDDAWHYSLAYFTDAAATTPVPAADLRSDGRPKKGGTYYAVATTYENSGYESATSESFAFKVTPFTVNTTVADKTFARTDWTIDDILSAGNSFPYGESATSILTIKEGGITIDSTRKFRNANDYTVTVSVNEALNYKLSGSATVKFAIKTDTSSDFDFSVTGWTYGQNNVSPDIKITYKSGPYYPSNTGTLATDYTVKYYEYDATATDNKGAAVSIPQTSGIDDFSKLEVGAYVVELTANSAGITGETAALATGKTVDYTLPVKCQSFVVSASPIEAPQLSAPWDTTEANGGLLYTYDDMQSGLPFTFSKWIGDGNNVAADGSAIITVAISYVTFVTETPNTLTLGIGGTFTVNEAGNYEVTVTLNKNYSWSTTAAWTPSDSTYTYYGYVARQKLTVLADSDISSDNDNVYDGAAQLKSIGGWNTNALKISSVTVSGLEDGHTPVEGGIITSSDNSNNFKITNAGKYAVKVDIVDQDNYEWDGATTDEQKLRTLSLEYTLNRAPMKVTWGTSNQNGTFDKTPITGYPRFEFDGGKRVQSAPAATVSIGGDIVTITGYTLYNDANGAFGTEITDVENIGYYRIVVSAIDGAAAPNYYLPDNDSEYITQIATVFEIYAKTFARPVLTVSGNDVEVVYKGSGYRISDFIQNFDNYVLNGVLRLDIKYGEDGENDPLLKDVLWNTDDTVKAYTITVKPADNYSWSTGTADETLTYTITITQKTVSINWGTTDYQTTYGEVGTPAPTVTNAETGDTVTVTRGYKKGETVYNDASIATADAGVYVVYAAALDNLNYKIDNTKSDYSIGFTIKKKALAKPTLNGAFANATFGTPVTASLYSNVATDKAAWQNDGGMLFSATVTAKRDKAWFTDSVADNDAVLVIDTSDTTKYAFNAATGVLTYYAAGIYTVTFTLTDSANYCWADDGKETEFTDDVSYTCAWNDQLTNKRKVIDAPALGSKRAMEAEGEDNTPLSAIFTGTIDGVAYGVQYGSRAGDGFGAPQAAQPDSTVRGQYYVLLTAADKYNYDWTVSSDDGNGGYLKSSYITQIDGKVYKTEYTKADGARVYLLYAITATQLNVELIVNNYTYGDNGYAIGVTAITEATRWVVDYTNENGDNKVFDYQNHHEHVNDGDNKNLPEHNDPEYTFFKIIGNNRVQVAAAELVEGLPWEAGDYEAEIAINFKDSDAYSPWTDTRKFTVAKREIVLEWTFDGNTEQNEGEFDTAIYNGTPQKPAYAITNVPKKTAADVPTEPQLTFAAAAINGKEAFVDAATYEIDSVAFAVSDGVNDNFTFGSYYLTFVISPKEVTLTATAQTYVYGDSLSFAASDCLDDATKAQFYERDGSVVTMRVQNASGTNLTNKLDVIYGGEYYLVPVFNTANSKRANYTITATIKAALTVQKRAITVTVTNTPSSVYSESIADIAYTVERDGNAVGAVVDSEADVFTIAARDGSGAAITNKTDVGDYSILLTLGERAGNYDITFSDSYKYSITEKQIVEAKDGEGNDTIVVNTLAYTGSEQKFLKDGFEVVIGNPEIEGNAPVWSYFKTDADYSFDADTEFTPFTESPTVKNAGKHYFVIKVTAANHTAFTKNIEVTVGKAELTVKFDLTIMIGEDDPASASVQYMFGLDNLRKENKGWTVTGFATAADRTLFYTDGAFFYNLAGKVEYSVDGYNKDATTTATHAISFIAGDDDDPTLTCDNYTFVGEVGTLTVKKVELTVNFNDLSVTYNEQNLNNIPSVNVPLIGYTVDVPQSTYDANSTYLMTEAFTEIFTVSTTAHDEKVGTSTTGKVGSYAISGTPIAELIGKYNITFVGGYDETLTASANGTCGKYVITPATITVKNTIQGYTGVYDEKWHGIVVDDTNTVQQNGDPTEGVTFATASDGTAVAVEYRVSDDELPVLNKSEFEKLTLSATAPKYRDVGTYYVYYSLSNANYTTVFDYRTVKIEKSKNGLSIGFNFQNNSVVLQNEEIAKDAWTYGYKVENGFDPDDANKVVEPEATFKYASGSTLGKITFRLYYNESGILTKTVDADAADTVAGMFAELFAGDGLNAGSYMLSVSMGGAANYDGFTTVYKFNVAKRALTVKAATPDDIEYGSVVPTFTDNSQGLVVNSSKSGATADTILDALDNHGLVYYTDYEQGNTVGRYRVYANGFANGNTDSTHFTNYTVEYNDVYLTVVPREITVNIADKQNTYNLRGDNNTTETVQTLTFTVTSGSIYTAEIVGGTAPEGGVYNNDNQTVLTLYTEAIKNGNTNDVKFDDQGEIVGYTIYAVFCAGVAETNYHVSFADCSNKEQTEATAIGYDGSANNAGSYIIKKAVFKLLQDGVYHNDGAEKIKGTVYSGAVNYYVATLDDTARTPLEFTYTKKDTNGDYVAINADQVVGVGEYEATGSSTNPNYTAAELAIKFEITKATLTLTATPTSVQYGTTLSGKVATDEAAGGAEATGRFDGFTYTFNSPTLLATTLSAYLANNTVGYETVGYTAKTPVVGSSCTITPVCKSDDNVTIVAVSATLTVKKREVTVTMVGWDEANNGDASKHNANAWCYYLGTHDATHDALVDSFTANRSSYIYFADSNVVFGDSGDGYDKLGITVSLPDGVNVREHDFDYAAANNTNYIVTFTNTVAPKFSVQKAKLTLSAHSVQGGTYAYTYGETIETLVDTDASNVGALTYVVNGIKGNDKFVNLLGNRNIVFTIVDGNGQAYEPWESGCGTYTVSLLIREGENEYAPTAATFQNYEIVSVVNASLKLNKRKISATTKDQTFGFDEGVYNGGLFGKSHNAVITFVDAVGNDANVDATAYRPSFDLSYNTTTLTDGKYGTYQTAKAAPTVVGNYKVTVKLGANGNYVFANGTDSLELDFNVNKLVLREANLGWDTVSYSMDDDLTSEKFTNFIERYVDDYFRVVRFVYTSATGDGTQIVAGDKDTLGTYYVQDQKMYVTFGRDVGTYTVSFVLKDSALGNLSLDSAIANEINVSFAVSQNKVTMIVEMADFTYGDQPSKVTVLINGGEATTGLTLTYAPVTSDNAAEFAHNSKDGKGLENVTGLIYGDLSNATNFNAGYYVLSAEYRLDEIITRRFYVFHVSKRVISAPQSSIADVTFNGSAQNVVIEYQTAHMRPELTTAGGSMTVVDKKATFTATAVGAYSIRFILIDPANNVWDKDGVNGVFSDDDTTLIFTWNITEDETANGTEDNPIVELPAVVDAITYGGAFDPDSIIVKNGYNGTVTLYRMPKTDDNVPAVSAEGWTEYNTADRGIDAGEYWLKVVLAGNRNFTTKATVGSFRIVPKTVTASISGSMIYGTALGDTNFDNIAITGLLYGYKPTIGAYSYELAQSYANLNAGGAYEIILATDGSDEVIGIDAGNNYIVKAARGTLTITKRAVTVTIESKSSDYSVTPVLSDVQYTAVGLADGEDKSVLGIVFETDATAKSAAGGTYWITVKSYDGTNYELTQNRALYVINPLEIEVELVRQQNVTYGDANIKGATAGDINVANSNADEEFVRNDLQLVIRFTGNGYDSFDVPTNAGTYTATLVGANSNYRLIGTPSISFVIEKKKLDVTAFYINAAIYTGEAITPRVDVRQQGTKPMYAPSVYVMTACSFTDAGTHEVTVSLADPANYVWSSTSDVSVTLTFIINKANDEQTTKLAIAGWQYGCYDAAVNSPSATVKSGESIIYQYSADGVTYTNIVPENGNAGKYYVRATVAESKNYRAFIGEPVSFDVAKCEVKSPSLLILTEGTGKNDVYSGADLALIIIDVNPQLMQISYDGNIHLLGGSVTVFARDAGTYAVSVSLFNARNYRWSAGDEDGDGTLVLTWTVARKKIAKPTHDDSIKIVNGDTLVYIPVGFDPSIMTIENNAYSYGGTFNAKIALKDTKNYEWATGDDTPFTITWSIVGADTVFVAIITVLSVLAAATAALILVQFLLNKRRKRMTANAMKEIEDADAQSAAATAATERPAEEKPAEQAETEQPQAEQPETEQTAEERSETEQSAEDKPADKKSTAKKSTTGKSATGKSTTKKSTTGKSATSKSRNSTGGKKSGKSAQGNKGGAE